LLWSAFETVGFFLILLRHGNVNSASIIAIQDIALIIGVVFLCVGILKFFDISTNRTTPIVCVIIFSLIHWGFQFIYDSIIIRSLLFSVSVSASSFYVVFRILKKRWNSIDSTVIFNAAVMTLHGGVFVFRSITIAFVDPAFNLFTISLSNVVQFFDAFVVSLLWTYGFIIMLNQKLNLEISEAKEHFENIFTTSPDAVAITRVRDGMYVACNDGFTNISGFSKEELIGNTAFEKNIWQNPVDRNNILEKVNQYGFCENYEAQFRRKDGSYLIGLMSAKIITVHGEPHLMSITRDISERKITENALQESEQQLQFVLEGGQLGFWDWNLETGEVRRNRRWAEMLGYTLEEIELTVKQWTDLIHPDDREKASQSINEHLEKKTHLHRSEYRMKTKDGQYRWILDQAKVVSWSADGKPLRMSGTHTDITEIKNIQEQITVKNQELTRTNSEKDKFFSIIAHDLKSPFTGFLGLTSVLAEEAESYSPKELSALSREMNHTATNLFQLLQNLLDWAQMKKGAYAFEPKMVSLGEIIIMGVDTMKRTGEQKNISVRSDLAESIWVYADDKMIRSVIINLVSNAIKFTHRGGEVIVSAKKALDGVVEVSVLDTGIGIQKSHMEKLFALGEKVRSKGTEGELSTGLGLLLCKEFIDKHNGKIWVESEVGKGSTFRFLIPPMAEN